MAADNEHACVKYAVNQIGCVTFAHLINKYNKTEIVK